MSYEKRRHSLLHQIGMCLRHSRIGFARFDEAQKVAKKYSGQATKLRTIVVTKTLTIEAG